LVLLQSSGWLTMPQQQQRQQQVVDTCLASTAWHSRPRPSLLQQHPADLTAQSALVKQADPSSSSGSGGASIWTVPPLPSPPAAAAAAGAPTPLRLPAELQQLVNMLLHYPRTPHSSSSSSGVFDAVMSEGEWLRGAEVVWDAVQDSSQLLQCYKAAAEARLMGAGSWRTGTAQVAMAQPGRDTW
jgi:hypothetical protein